MKKLMYAEFKPGRLFMGRLPHGQDLIAAIEGFCQETSLPMATFSLIGAVTSFTIGAYDQKQQVYITAAEKGPFEIVTCTGNISLMEGEPFVHAHIVLGDPEGRLVGGHLFSETIIYAGEIGLQELAGKPLERAYDQTTGLSLWNLNPASAK
jgi:uncharacterized protein